MALLKLVRSKIGYLQLLLFTARDNLFRVIIRYGLSICMTEVLNIHALLFGVY